MRLSLYPRRSEKSTDFAYFLLSTLVSRRSCIRKIIRLAKEIPIIPITVDTEISASLSASDTVVNTSITMKFSSNATPRPIMPVAMNSAMKNKR